MCAIAFIVASWNGDNTQLEGVFAFGALLGIGVGLIVWANGLLADGQHEDHREPLRGSPEDRAVVNEEISRGSQIQRRTLLRRTLLLAGGAVGASVAVPLRSLGPSPGGKLLHTSWSNGVRVATQDGTVVRAQDVPLDGLLTVFPEHALGSADSQVVMVRVDPSLLQLAPGRANWAPQGIVAYSKVCTHAACPVGLYQADTHRLLCPCHQSAFDVLHAARPVSGPAAWPLPQLPLTIDADGTLRATGDFSEPIGPGWWRA